jgi:hypothetical protein
VIDHDFETYCESIEAEFFRMRGRNGMLSPSDFARTKTWFEAEIPLDDIFEGIADAFDGLRAGRQRDVEEVNSLAYCEPFVERAIARRHGVG